MATSGATSGGITLPGAVFVIAVVVGIAIAKSD